jgi:hypothetical protein
MTTTKPDLSQCCTQLAAALDADANANPAGAAVALRSFLESFLALDESERDEIRSLLQPPEARKIAGLGVVASEEALAQRAPEWLKWSLLAHDVEQFRDDPRNNYPLLAVTAYAAEQLGLEPRKLFEELALSMSARSQSFIRMFAARSAELNSLAAMCVRVVSEAGRTRFQFE